MKSIGHFINGKEIPGKSDRRGKVFNPATGEVQAEVAYAAKSELDNALLSAKLKEITVELLTEYDDFKYGSLFQATAPFDS